MSLKRKRDDDISEQCSHSISNAILTKSSIPDEEIELIRRQYLSYWPNFSDVKNFIDEIINKLEIDGLKIKFLTEEQELLTNYGLKKINKYAFVGRAKECDIVINDLDSKFSCSRIQCIIIITSEKTYVIDLWSILGTKTINTGNTKKIINSIPNDRKILEFELNETFQLRFGDNINFIVGRNECGICFNSPQSTRLKCGHSLCNKCSELTKKCPYCRNPINEDEGIFSQCYEVFKK